MKVIEVRDKRRVEHYLVPSGTLADLERKAIALDDVIPLCDRLPEYKGHVDYTVTLERKVAK
ncbi:MAG: hypothetical protein HYS81_00465 [Candidatus Aenigmatarchaeota archaeon]|nr:MAG: hypothetical protein HYS81_00465 [Candidatus Aenigmarchaeota archaeon]